MSNTAIKVENLSKIYRLGEIGTGTISRDMERWFKTKVLKQEDPFLKIGETNDRANKGASDIVYSLQDINFEINQGDAVGIIGRNGAGKSTLLKILSRVTTPTTGKINIKGRVASLLEVGTGFHPELTGRENIYLNGAILGMRKREIDRKLDEIIDFSGVERYIDTPVKRYSSGMYVRLAFAVAAHLESEILIVDEVLAVGDAEFQKKCLGKMGEVSKGEGRTVLFVSHNMAAVKTLCGKGVLLDHGKLIKYADCKSVLDTYFESTIPGNFGLIPKSIARYNTGQAFCKCVWILNSKGLQTDKLYLGEKFVLEMEIEIIEDIANVLVDFEMVLPSKIVVSHSQNLVDINELYSFDKGTYLISIEVDNIYQPGYYSINLGLHFSIHGTPTIDFVEDVGQVEILDIELDSNVKTNHFHFKHGNVRPKTNWKFQKK